MAYYPYSTEIGAIYTLTSSETGSVAVLNDPFDVNYAGMLTEVSGLDSPDIRESAEDLVEADGGVHGRFYYGRRPITMNGRLFGHATVKERTLKLDLLRRATQAMRVDGYLSWKPSKYVENLMSNPRFVARAIDPTNPFSVWTNVTSGGSATRVQSTGLTTPFPGLTTAHTSTFTATAASQNNDVRAAPALYSTQKSDLSVSSVYPTDLDVSQTHVRGQFSAQLVSTSTGPAPTIQMLLNVYDSTNAYLGSIVMDTRTSQTPGGWFTMSGAATRASIIAAYPAATRVTVGARLVSQAAAVYVWRVTAAHLSFGRDTIIPTYIDGSYSGGPSGGYWWGEENDSPSGDYVPMGTNFRRQQPFRESGGWVKDFQVQLVSAEAPIMSPWIRPYKVTSGGPSVLVSNYGNAYHYPLVGVNGPMNAWSKITGSGNELQIINPEPTTGYPSGIGAGSLGYINTLKHTWKTDPGYDFEQNINWAPLREWPRTAPAGGTWSFINGSAGGTQPSTGYLMVLAHDAWV